MIIRAILPPWAAEEDPTKKRVKEGNYNDSEISNLNAQYYNIYYLPNFPSNYDPSKVVDGTQIDTFHYVFVDMDLKEKKHAGIEDFISVLNQFPLSPTKVVVSGNGVHAYWRITDLDAMSFLRLQRRLCRHLNTDEAVSKIYQLMRVPGTVNTKDAENLKLCDLIEQNDQTYTCEQLDSHLPSISIEDEEYCKQHFDKTYQTNTEIKVDDRLPTKFGKLLDTSQEVKDIWVGNTDDRSKSDFRLGHLMRAHGFTKDEAMSVLVNTAKALSRAPKHRVNYAANIVDQIWTSDEPKDNSLSLSSSVKELLSRPPDSSIGERFSCHRYLDNTAHGFRLGQVIGLVAGSGVGKTAVALNMFMGFVENNPDFDHFFVPLEQPAQEIAERWRSMCGENTYLYDKVHIINNYDERAGFRHLSLAEIQEYIVRFQQKTNKKIGAVVIDHIGALKKKDKEGNRLDLEDLCREMKSFAVTTNTMLVMQSQTSREKAGIGDLELDKDAAYGTVFFEAFCDYLITIWQPLKRCYSNNKCPTITAFKFCKIRHKKQGVDVIKEDERYALIFDSSTERLREMTQDEEKSFTYFNTQATNARKKDRKTDLLTYTSVKKVDESQITG